ncbi:MAG TPA: hypothetical protein VK671_03475, partial [Mucilaginibacter sp.]|nr:hypothetical protein [Mucilaginibacter sp.]
MLNERTTPIRMGKDEFKQIGYQLIDQLSTFLDTIEDGPVTPGESPGDLQKLLGNEGLPETGSP